MTSAFRIAFMLCLLLAHRGAEARPALPGLPTLNRETVNGVWEAVNHDDLRVHRLEIRSGEAESFVAVAVGRARATGMVFAVKELSVANGKVHIDGAGMDTTDQIRIRGHGVGTAGEGILRATVTLLDMKGRVVNSWPAIFVNIDGEYIERLHRLSSHAKAEIERAQTRK